MQELTSIRYVPNPKIVFESLDGEVIMIDFEKGHYYSLHKSSAQIWNLITTGATLDQILSAFAQAYDESIEAMQLSIIDFIRQLEGESLIIASTMPAENITPISMPKHDVFVVPKLETYTDMNDLLLLDPIHDVDDVRGWPDRQ